MYYLQDEDLARQLVELGYRGSGDTLQRWVVEATTAVDTSRFLLSVHWAACTYRFNVQYKQSQQAIVAAVSSRAIILYRAHSLSLYKHAQYKLWRRNRKTVYRYP